MLFGNLLFPLLNLSCLVVVLILFFCFEHFILLSNINHFLGLGLASNISFNLFLLASHLKLIQHAFSLYFFLMELLTLLMQNISLFLLGMFNLLLLLCCFLFCFLFLHLALHLHILSPLLVFFLHDLFANHKLTFTFSCFCGLFSCNSFVCSCALLFSLF